MDEAAVLKTLFRKYRIPPKDPAGYFNELSAQVAEKADLTPHQAAQAMTLLMSGLLSEVQIASFLTAMHMKQETIDEIAAAAQVMRACAASVVSEKTRRRWRHIRTVDTCGTGGGTVSTFNISTAVAVILAAAGLHVAKHGNRAITSRAGSADVFEALGAPLSITPPQVGDCILEIGLGFLFAPAFHQATRHVQKVRRQLKHKTFFNILGPLTNPTAPRAQVIGVYGPELTTRLAQVLAKLDVQHALVVHGMSVKKGESLDEISLLGRTKIAELKNGKIKNYLFDPKTYGFKYCTTRDLRGGTPDKNAAILRRILGGRERGPKRDVVLLNAGAALYVSGKARSLRDGIAYADTILKNGTAARKLDEFITCVQRHTAS